MRTPILEKRRLVQTATVFTLPAPTGGWNARDNLAAMPPLDAIRMINYFPEVDGVTLRKGDVLFATGLSGEVEWLFEHVGLTSNDLLAASDSNVYDITAGGAIGGTIGTGLGNAQWQAVTYNARTFIVNGAALARDWDGTTLNVTAWTGVTTSVLINVNVIRDRVWFTEKDKALAWYGGVGSVTGALTSFNIGEVARSGFLMQIASWSRDAGDGQDDFTVFIMSTGECLVYQGDVSSTFSLVGRYKAPEPIGRRCTINWGGELIIITRSGYLGMTGIMQGKARPADAISEKIRNEIAQAVENGGALNGWEAIRSPDGRKIYFNVPVASASIYHQHVFNTINLAWGKQEDRNHRSIGTLDDEMYGGFNTEVYRLDDGLLDNSASLTTVNGDCKQAFNSLTMPNQPLDGLTKQVTILRPFINAGGEINFTNGVFADFSDLPVTANLQSLNTDAMVWEEYTINNWEDETLVWEDGVGISSANLTVSATGVTFAPFMKTESDQAQTWQSTDIIYKIGGIG